MGHGGRPTAEAMVEIASRGPPDLKAYADWWIDFRSNNLWRDYSIARRHSRDAAPPITEVNGVALPERPAFRSEGSRGEGKAPDGENPSARG